MFRRTLQQVIVRKFPKRNMAGHGHAPVHYEGVEAVVRKYLPGDHHMALGIMGFYATLFGIWKIKSAFSKPSPKPVEAPPAKSTDNGGMPSFDSPEFVAWLEAPGNIERLFTEQA